MQYRKEGSNKLQFIYCYKTINRYQTREILFLALGKLLIAAKNDKDMPEQPELLNGAI